MLEFMAGVERGPSGASIGTIASVVDLYQTDQDKPLSANPAATRPGYDRALAIVRSTVDERRVDTVTANDVRRWFNNWGAPTKMASLPTRGGRIGAYRCSGLQ